MNMTNNEEQDDVAAVFGSELRQSPTPAQQSRGAVISICIIMLMVIIGAYYSYNKRVSQLNDCTDCGGANSATSTGLNTITNIDP